MSVRFPDDLDHGDPAPEYEITESMETAAAAGFMYIREKGGACLKRRQCAGLVFRIMTLVFFLFLLSENSEAADPGVISLAKKNTYEIGGFAADEKGICYLDQEGEPVKNRWAMIAGKVYCFDRDGYCITGFFRYKKASYFAWEDGHLAVDEMVTTGDKIRYFGKTGAMKKKCWVNLSGNKYYFDGAGVMVVNRWIGNYYAGADGRRVSGVIRKNILNKSTKKEISGGRKLIIIGASRVNMMRQAVKKDAGVVYLTGIGKGLGWFQEKGLPKLHAYLALFPKSTVVIQLGNNDLKTDNRGRFGNYAAIYKKLIKKYTGARFYLMDILPGENKKLNKLRVAFNQKLEKAFPERYIGGYDYLVEKGYQTSDGTHYTDETSCLIYDYIIEKIRWSS